MQFKIYTFFIQLGNYKMQDTDWIQRKLHSDSLEDFKKLHSDSLKDFICFILI